jgi:general secretion pathway protein F
MPIFEYRGLTKEGKNTKGVIDSENQRTAKTKLKKDGIYVTELKDKKKGADTGAKKKRNNSTKNVGVKDISLMTRQLATLIKANIPLVDALQAVSEQVENPTLAEAVADCKNMVNEGSSLYKAISKYPNIFTNIFVSMVEAGEASGTLDTILLRLAEFTEAQNELRSKVKGALTYPLVMLVVTMGLLAFLFIFVIPKMVAIFESAPELKIPWYTTMMIDISGIMVNYWYVILSVMVISYLAFLNWKKSTNGRKQWDAVSLKIPIFGDLNRLVAVARFSRTLATLLNGGVPMLQAMHIVRNVVDNHVIATAIDDARSNISEGETIAGPLKKSGQFPPMMIHMVNVGEKTGELEKMLIQVADTNDFQVKNMVDSLTGLMGPVVLIVMGFAVGVIVFAVMVPMFEMTNLGG